MFDRILAIATKEFHQIWRDKRSLGLLVFVPVFTLLLFGFALSLDVTHVRIAFVDNDRSVESRRFLASFSHTEFFEMMGQISSTSEIQHVIELGLADLVVVVPPGFARDLMGGRQAAIQAIVNGGNASVATAAAGYVEAFTQSYSAGIRARVVKNLGIKSYQPVDYRPRIWFNPELKSSKFLVPGLMGYIIIITTVISTALSIVREKERGTIEQIMVSPVSSREFMFGKTIPYFFIASVLAAGIVGAGWLLFDIPVRGSIPMLAISLLFFILGGLGMGLAISSIARTQEAAFFIAVFSTVLPTQLLSGFIFPIENMPAVLRFVTNFVPARYLLTILRSILLKGAPLEAYWQSFAAIVLFAIVTMTVAIRRMKKSV